MPVNTDKKLPVIPALGIARVLQLRDKIADDLELLGFIDEMMSPDDIEDFVRRVNDLVPTAKPEAVLASSTYLATAPLTAASLKQYAWRLAANVSLLEEGKAVTPWVTQAAPEWMAMQFVDCLIKRNRRQELVADYTLRVLSGTAAGMLIHATLNRKICGGLAKELGFGNKYKQRPNSVKHFKEFSEFVGLRIVGLFEPELCLTTPKFWHMACPSGCKNYNRKLLKKRARLGFKCPKGYTHPCSLCHIGYDQCSAATHPRSYVMRMCDKCKEDNWFDEKQNPDMCISCLTKQRLRS